jgi:hypothetical protein
LEPLKNLGSEAKDYSDYSDYQTIHFSSSPPTQPTLVPKDELENPLPFAGPSEPSPKGPFETSSPEKEVVYLFTPGVRRCSVCGWDVWKVEKRIYKEGKGEAQCLKCGRLGWFREFPWGKEVDEKDLPLLLYRLIPVEAKMVIRIDKDGKLEVEGGEAVNPDLFKKLLPQN